MLSECDASPHRFRSQSIIYFAHADKLRRSYDQRLAKRAYNQCRCVDHRIVALSWASVSYGANTRSGGASLGETSKSTDFYPFIVTRENFGEFSLKDFRLGMHYFLKNEDHTAARQLIFIGEQNNVRAQLEPTEQKVYAQLFEKYDGKRVTDDTHEFLENYERIVRLIGKSFPNTGIEILLHNLADPAHSLITLENNVTGRHLRDGTTNLLIDLKRRQLLNEDKLNYELNIGARKFKCTTIPIKRKEFGIVGAICINIDANYISEEVLRDRQRIETWFQNFLRTDMQLDENILSKDEYAKAQKGQRHFKEEGW